MTRVAVVIGSTASGTVSGALALPMSDRGALALALARFGEGVCAYASDPDAGHFALAAGVAVVEELSGLEAGGFDVVLIGRGGCGPSGDALPARLAEEGGAALVYAVCDVQPESDRLVVTRDLDRGAKDVLGVRGRAVLVVSDSVARGPYVSRHRINAAKAVRANWPERDETSSIRWNPATPRVRLGDCASRVAGRAVERMNALFGLGESDESAASLVRGSADESARQLLRYLSHHGFIERGLGGAGQGAAGEVVVPQPAERRPAQSATAAESIPMRAQRRPRPAGDPPIAARGPFEVGVDI
jgi:electron transfer flavoprotein alpha/beta subunit